MKIKPTQILKTLDHKSVYSLLSVAIFIAVWSIASAIIGAEFVLPSPNATLSALVSIIKGDTFLLSLWTTFLTALWSFSISFVLGLTMAVLAKLNIRVHYMMLPFAAITRTLPVTGIILVIFVVFGTQYATYIISFLVIFPLVYAQCFTAINKVDSKLIAMAGVFKVGKLRQVSEIYIPLSLPYILSAAAAGFGLNIKVIISAEVLSMPPNTIGANIKFFYNWLQSPEVFAWILIAVLLSMACEFLINQAGRWLIRYD